jgi:hypothetical protein
MMPSRETPQKSPGVRSGGPKTVDGVERCKFNALRHGLRAVDVVVPGEAIETWEAHRAAVVDDLEPAGALERALAEQVAAKLWRLGRVVRHEADLIANGQAPDELTRGHQLVHGRDRVLEPLGPADIPMLEDIRTTRRDALQAREKARTWATALGQLEALAAMADGDAFPSWELYETLRDSLRFKEKELDRLFAGEEAGPFLARHARAMLAKHGDPSEVAGAMVGIWREKAREYEAKARKAERHHRSVTRRYRGAIERRRRENGLPGAPDLDRIQRYEAHLERGLHKALERLRDLKQMRGAAPPPAPAVAVAVVQAGTAPGPEASPFGRIALEGTSSEEGRAAMPVGGGGPVQRRPTSGEVTEV